MKRIEFLRAQKNVVQKISEQASSFLKLSADELNQTPPTGDWSALQCFEHLNLYNRYYISELKTAMNEVSGRGEDFGIEFTWIGKKSIAMMHPSNRKKQKTFKKMIPVSGTLSVDLIHAFLDDQKTILELLDAAATKDITKKKVKVEFFRLLKMNIAETIEFVLVHEQRHILQATTTVQEAIALQRS